MNLDSLSFTLSQINHIITNLTKKNYKSSQSEILGLIESQGFEAERHLYRCLFSSIDFNSETKTSAKDYHQTQYLKECLITLLTRANFISIITFAIDNPLNYQETLKTPSSILSNISRTLKLNILQDIAFAIALQNSTKEEIRRKAQEYLYKKFTELVNFDSDTAKEVNFNEISVEILQLILIELESYSKTNSSINTREFYLKIQRELPKENLSDILIPYIYPENIINFSNKLDENNIYKKSIMESTSVVDIIQDYGYSFTLNLEECKQILLGISSSKDIFNAFTVAKILGMMAKTHTGLYTDHQTLMNPNTIDLWNGEQQGLSNQTWNVEIFVQAIHELIPTLSWKEVVKELDYPEFIIKDKNALRLITTAFKRGLRDTFPIEYLYRMWKNTEGQLSWIIQSLKHPDIFCIADYQCRRTVTECLKAQPEDDNRSISSWRSLNLIEVLLLISESGLYASCFELLKFPITHCPDLLLLGLLQLNTIWNKLKQELITVLIPIFLGNHPNSAVILQYAWNQNTYTNIIRTIIMNSMADWYMKAQDNEQNARLARILDVSQDLKALFMLLNGQPMLFNIDLACLAARRGYLKLDKWMSDRIRDHGELFIATVIGFLKRKMPLLSNSLGKDDQSINSSRPMQMPLLTDTLKTILQCISNSSITVSPELSQEIAQINTNISILIDKVATISNQKATVAPNQMPSNQGFEVFQTMMNNLNLNNSNSLGLNSPGKLLTQNINLQQHNQNLSLNSMQGYPNSNLFQTNNLDSNKVALVNNLLNTNIRASGYPTNLIRPMNSHNELLEQNISYSKDLEEDVEKIMQRILKNMINVDEFADFLNKFKDSHEKKEKDFYNSVFKYLFDANTLTSLHSLDEIQLITMSSLWGSLIDKCVFTNYFLKYCLELLKQMFNSKSKYFYFVMRVLDRCKNRLKENPDFCQQLMQMQNYSEVPKPLKDYIEFGVRGMMPTTAAVQQSIGSSLRSSTPPLNLNLQRSINSSQLNTSSIMSSQALNKVQQILISPQTGSNNTLNMASINLNHSRSLPGKPSIANTTNIETLLVANENDTSAKPIAPNENIQDKVGFIFNNLSLSNMQAKSDEIKDIIKDEFWEWISHYLVVKRVSIEPNFHTLYSQFIDTLRNEPLNESILSETYRNIKVLLRSDKNEQKFCDRALLKNLGSWLGLITLAKNKPILQKDIDLKSLIVEAFQKGQTELLFVVPFVAKVLEPAGKSRIFQPPNPWLSAMLSILVELHNEPDLKLNHKFEIEVLCKNLSVNITDIPVKNVLRTYEVTEEQLTKRKDDYTVQPVSASSVSPSSAINTPVNNLTQTSKESKPAATTTSAANPNDVTSSTNVPNETAVNASNDNSAVQSQTSNSYVLTTPMPKFKLTDIKIQSIQSNSNYVHISPDIQLFNANPGLKNLIIPALERAVNDMLPLLLDKAVKISVNTAEPLIKKDFSLDPEENHMKIAARNMVANMSSGMMLITGKEPLANHLLHILKLQLTQPLDPNLANAFKDMISFACTTIVQDNIDLCMCYMQKIAIQKSIMELERKLQPEFEVRQRARNEGRNHYETTIYNQNEKMPEMIRLRVGSVSQQQFSVYEEFGKNLPGFKIHSDEKPNLTNFNHVIDEMNIHYDRLLAFLDNEIANMPQTYPFMSAGLSALSQAIQEFKLTQHFNNAINLVKRLIYNLLESTNSHELVSGFSTELMAKYRESNLNVLKVILNDQRFVSNNWIVKEVQKIWLECTQDYKYSVEGVAILFKLKLLNMQTVDTHIAQFIDAGNMKAIQFATQVIKFFYVEQASMFNDIDFNQIMEAITKVSCISRISYQNNELRDLLEVIRMNYDNNNNDRICATALSMMYTGVSQARDFEDPPGLKEKSDQLLLEWIQHHGLLPNKENTKAFQHFVLQMNSQGLFKTDDMITRFFRICTELCVDACYSNINKGLRQSCYIRLDAFVKLIILLVKHSGDQTSHINKINLFNKVLGLIAGCLLYDQETKQALFEPMPFHRLLFMLLFEATLPENNLEPIIFHILQAFVNVFHVIRPSKAPGFAYSWLELISHRLFTSRMLYSPQPTPDTPFKQWNMYAILLTQLIRFLSPYLRNIELTPAVMLLYKGTLRLFLVLLHDFPEFLCSCHYQLCDVIPPNCIQLRNLVLSAFPRFMKLPDPLTPNLKVDMIGDISDANPPKINFQYIYNIPQKLKNDLDTYIKSRSPVTFLSELRSYLQSSPDPGCHYNIQLMNALVIYVGTLGIQALRSKNIIPSLNTLSHPSHSAHSDIFQSLVVDLDSEGRYLFINAVANQLRYPNSHTHYFGCALLNLFAEANSEAIQEQITRVLLERLIVNRPHPWGLLVTFIELIKNSQFKFWSHSFVHCAPEIEKMFQSLGKSCIK